MFENSGLLQLKSRKTLFLSFKILPFSELWKKQLLERDSPVHNQHSQNSNFINSLSNESRENGKKIFDWKVNAYFSVAIFRQPSEEEIKKQFEEAVISSIQGRDLKLDEVWVNFFLYFFWWLNRLDGTTLWLSLDTWLSTRTGGR